MSKPRFARFFIVLAVLLPISALYAEDNSKSFRIEVIPFANLMHQTTAGNEEWKTYQSKIQWPESISEITQGAPQFEQVKAATPRLTGPYNSLNRASQYAPLSLNAWYISIPANQWSKAVHIQRGVYHEDSYNANDYYLNGYVRLQRGYYLHLLIDMEYQAPGDPRLYHIRERRRIHSGDTHYFDNPAFGVVANVNILKPAEEKTE